MPLQGSRGPWCQLLNSGMFFPADPRPGEFTAEQIAHGLSIEPRYGGQAPYPYSVAQHSINVSLWAEQLAGKDEVERLLCAWDGLFHDASEGLGLKDIPSPVKMLLKPLYAPLEDKLMNALAQQFRFRWPMNGVVKTADMDVFGTEATVMFPIEERPEKWQGTGQQVPGLDVSEWPDWRQTRARWMARYEDLKTRMEKLHG